MSSSFVSLSTAWDYHSCAVSSNEATPEAIQDQLQSLVSWAAIEGEVKGVAWAVLLWLFPSCTCAAQPMHVCGFTLTTTRVGGSKNPCMLSFPAQAPKAPHSQPTSTLVQLVKCECSLAAGSGQGQQIRLCAELRYRPVVCLECHPERETPANGTGCSTRKPGCFEAWTIKILLQRSRRAV